MSVHRRALLQAGAATLALQALPADAQTADAAADRLLARITEQLLNDYPESATSAGVDKDGRARLRARLANHSASGQNAIRSHVRSTLGQLQRLNADGLSVEKRLDVDVVRAVYELASEGFQFPYGDVAILNNNWSYRNTPYVVAQNVGAFVEIPSFLDSVTRSRPPTTRMRIWRGWRHMRVSSMAKRNVCAPMRGAALCCRTSCWTRR